MQARDHVGVLADAEHGRPGAGHHRVPYPVVAQRLQRGVDRGAEAARGRLEADAREIAREISSNLLGRAVGGGGR